MQTTEKAIRDFAFKKWGVKTDKEIALKLCEEAGEVAGAAIKIPEGRAALRDMHDEVGDVLIVLSQYAAQHNCTLEYLRAVRFEAIRIRATNASQPCAD